MSLVDWIVLALTIIGIAAYGMWKSRGQKNLESYFRGDNSMPWYTVGLSIMATQASAITFLSAPGQAYTDGMRFVQYYFGLPLAMILISAVFIPIYHRLKVYTAYEFLENRFDLKTRTLAAFLFLIQRGLAAGLTIYAPSIILSSILGWNIYLTNAITGGVVILYIFSGGTKAVSYTQLTQMAVILGGMLIAGYMIVKMLPEGVGFQDALVIGGQLGHMNVIDFTFDLTEKYNIWSGIIGGFFLALSYFGTDQSQVGRYITGKSVAQIRFGLLFNGAVKIPMQFFILLTGILLLAFYQFEKPPVFFNHTEIVKLEQSPSAGQYADIKAAYDTLHTRKQEAAMALLEAVRNDDEAGASKLSGEMRRQSSDMEELRNQTRALIKSNDPLADTNDTNYIFLDYITRFLPAGLVGLLIAVIFCASMSSTSSELNALASTTVVDIYKRSIRKHSTERQDLKVSKIATILWGLYAIGVANLASELGSLIEAVNVLGSLFYGTILGIFLVAFFMKRIKGNAVFAAAIVSEAVVIFCYLTTELTFLWFNLLGCALVMVLSWIFSYLLPQKPAASQATVAGDV